MKTARVPQIACLLGLALSALVATPASAKLPSKELRELKKQLSEAVSAGKWEEAVATYDSMPSDMERNDAIVNAAVAAATTGGAWRTAVRVLEEAVASGVRARTSSFNLALKCLADADRQPDEVDAHDAAGDRHVGDAVGKDLLAHSILPAGRAFV